ncbi:hypothetical protein BU26DRAFT_571114 [Trematosphaeria pertusa]|uniref:Uncharacterized protein n=1 Tax=Trematosphaeria pertusa TaxID=390896 RepID=A0A6A6HXJ0_9PLEO|nr:uncharacterized protein BU26DRAFT_571114 [Trematosphaeria pertusa]KAF2242442.1 hypothetical protein BU26DRAFT_571114 [Trematosphaeria pertusa]
MKLALLVLGILTLVAAQGAAPSDPAMPEIMDNFEEVLKSPDTGVAEGGCPKKCSAEYNRCLKYDCWIKEWNCAKICMMYTCGTAKLRDVSLQALPVVLNFPFGGAWASFTALLGFAAGLSGHGSIGGPVDALQGLTSFAAHKDLIQWIPFSNVYPDVVSPLIHHYTLRPECSARTLSLHFMDCKKILLSR